MTVFIVCITAVILQRLAELIVAHRHTVKMLNKGAFEYDRKGYRVIVLMHTCFFLSLVSEYFIFQKSINPFWYIFAVLLLSAQVLRYWAIKSLGMYWNTRIIVLEGSELIHTGPYRYFNHPNYIAVVMEIMLLPLIFSCYFTSIVFTILNIYVLRRRVGIETNALNHNNI